MKTKTIFLILIISLFTFSLVLLSREIYQLHETIEELTQRTNLQKSIIEVQNNHIQAMNKIIKEKQWKQ